MLTDTTVPRYDGAGPMTIWHHDRGAAMSFDLFFQPCRSGNEPVERRNPFTGEIQTSLPVEPLSAENVRAIRAVLAGVGACGLDEFGCFVVELGDGGVAEVFASDLATGCMVAIRDLTPDLLRFLHDLLIAAEWVLLPAMEGNPAIVKSPGLASRFADSLPEVVCGSPEELGEILSGGFEAWRRYRDRVVGEGE
jgi:hypothetical protein